MESKIRALIKQSMLEKNKNKTITYRSILETAQKTAKKTNASVTGDMIVSAIKNEIKQLQDLLKVLKSEFGANMDGRIASMVAKNYINV